MRKLKTRVFKSQKSKVRSRILGSHFSHSRLHVHSWMRFWAPQRVRDCWLRSTGLGLLSLTTGCLFRSRMEGLCAFRGTRGPASAHFPKWDLWKMGLQRFRLPADPSLQKSSGLVYVISAPQACGDGTTVSRGFRNTQSQVLCLRWIRYVLAMPFQEPGYCNADA